MGRREWSRRWIAASGGVLVNALVLGALVLIEEPAPVVGEQPVIILDLERPERQTSRRRATGPARSARASSPAPAAHGSTVAGEAGPPETAPGEPAPAAIDPAWRVDPKVVDRWRLQEGNPSMGIGRFQRACLGHTSEHMTPEEKESCYNAWGKRPDKRPSPNFIGPIDERNWEEHMAGPRKPPTADEDKRRRRDLCRVVGRLSKANPSGPPLVRQGACP